MRTQGTVKLLLFSKHPIVRPGIRTLLNRDHSIKIVGEVRSSRPILEEAMRRNPDCVLLDVDSSGHATLSVIRRLRKAGNRVEILLFSLWEDPNRIEQYLPGEANDDLPGMPSPTNLLRTPDLKEHLAEKPFLVLRND